MIFTGSSYFHSGSLKNISRLLITDLLLHHFLFRVWSLQLLTQRCPL